MQCNFCKLANANISQAVLSFPVRYNWHELPKCVDIFLNIVIDLQLDVEDMPLNYTDFTCGYYTIIKKYQMWALNSFKCYLVN
jgi:hypothetical protein